MFYVGIYRKGRTPLIVTSDFGDTITHGVYQEILDDEILPILRKRLLTLQADNARAHSCADTQEMLQLEHVDAMW